MSDYKIALDPATGLPVQVPVSAEELAALPRGSAVQVKTWPNAEYFMAEFTLAEMGAIALSSDPTIAALRLMLSTWFSTVRADDERVVMGLDSLVAAGIINDTRRADITSL